MRRFVLLSSLLIIVAALSVACGDDDDPVQAGDDGTTGDSAPDDGDGGPLGAGPYPIADLTITYEHPDEGVSLTYRISCLGDTATVTGDAEIDAPSACLALAEPAVQTRLVDGPPTDVACTEQYGGPDIATITGTLDEQPVDTTVDRTNGCGISDWDVLLGAVLPDPIGVTT